MYEFPCGCKVQIVDETIKQEDGLPSLDIDIEEINYNCPATWALYAEGKTKGVFQLEKALGQGWSKQVQPTSIEEVAALISIIRPGTLKSLVDDKSMTKHFVDRKNGKDSFHYFHPDAEPILKESYGVIIYQEQTLAIAKHFANFTLQQADSLRKAMGKKLADVMAKCGKEFIDGCKNAGIICLEDAEALFDIIEKSNRYSFNKSHAISYGITGYIVAWIKAHFPLHFYCSSLLLSKDKMKPRDEVKELILDSKYFSIDILPPLVKCEESEFCLENGKIRFGIGNVKDVGESKVEKIYNAIKEAQQTLNKHISEFSYYEMLTHVMWNIDKTSANNLILCGAFSGYQIPRKKMLYEYKKLIGLTEKEYKWILSQSFTSLESAIEGLIKAAIPNKKRIEAVKELYNALLNPPQNLQDTTEYIASAESELLGISLTCSKLDGCDISQANCTIADFLAGKDGKSLTFAVQLDNINSWYPNGTDIPILFVDCHDETGMFNAMLPSNLYKEYSSVLFKNNTVLISGYRSKKGNLNIKKVVQL